MAQHITAIFNIVINCLQEKEKMTLANSAFKDWAAQAESLRAVQQSPWSSILPTGAKHGLSLTSGRIPSTAQPQVEDTTCFLDSA